MSVRREMSGSVGKGLLARVMANEMLAIGQWEYDAATVMCSMIMALLAL